MEKIQSKFFEGASSVQEGLKKGKQKFESSQELNDLKGEVNSLQTKRTAYILEIGEDAYSKVRMDKSLSLPFTEEVKALDKKIFILLKKIEAMNKIEGNKTCECGKALTNEDRFCKNCGKKVLEEETLDMEDMIACNTCETPNSNTNKYCNCCGHALV